MKKYFVIFSLAVPALFWSCSSDTDAPKNAAEDERINAEFAQPVATTSSLDLSAAQSAAISGYNELGWKTFEAVLNANPAENHSLSPVSINSALSLLASVEDESDSRAKLVNTLGFTDAAELDDFNRQLLSFLPSETNGVDLSLANSLWLAAKYTPEQELVKSVAEFYGATLKSVDFNDVSTVAMINAWVNDYTRGLIPAIVEKIEPSTLFCITNALYFNGDWKKAFNPEDSYDGKFTSATGSVKATYMERLDELKYSQNEDFRMTSLPFKGGKIVMDLILPDDGKDLSFAEYTSLCSTATTDSVALTMPKFELTTDYSNLTDIMKQAGIPQFNHYMTRLGIPSYEPCYINRFIHKMFVNVSENGAEAAAASFIGMAMAADPDSEQPASPYKFVSLTKPFYFVIREVEHNILLAVGHVNDPSL
ncbi:MAG: hypothetical protein K2M19_04425 [Muribaculaceae bacterium]|nr:hypothetical protein [Muribaculaceae bacterium]